MDNVVIIVPTDREAAFFPERGLDARICGAGMAECAAATAGLLAAMVLEGKRPELAVLAGIAGSYVEGLAIGDTVAVVSETVADLGRRNPEGGLIPLFQKTYTASVVPEGVAVVHANTVNTAGALCRADEPSEIRPAEEGATIENMEGAAFFAVCERFGVPAMEIRTISNRVGEPVTPEALTYAARKLAEELEKIVNRYRPERG